MAARFVLSVAASVLLVTSTLAAQDLTRKEADSMYFKLAAIVQRGVASMPKAPANPKGKVTPVRTPVSERELNAYLKFHVADLMPPGVKDPRVTMLGGGKVETRALVDLDAVRKSQVRGWLDPMAYITGIVEVKAAGWLAAAQGKGRFSFESATVGGVPVPKTLLQELVNYYSRTPELPQGVNLDQPFDLPAGIREVQLGRGAATIIQ